MNVTLHHERERAEHETRDADRRWAHYSKTQGVSARHRAAMKEVEPVQLSSRAEALKDLERLSRDMGRLKDTVRRLPAGQERYQVVRDCLAAGMRKAEVARLFGVSPQRITEILKSDSCPF